LGGGILILGSEPLIRDNIIKDNHSSSGGGIYCANGSPRIISNLIQENTAIQTPWYFGGGIASVDSDPEIIDNIIIDNRAYLGGGICCYNSNAAITGNIISNNLANPSSGRGGGMYFGNSTSIIDHNLIIENYSTERGGGIYSQVSNLTMIGNTISGNVADDYGGGIFGNYSAIAITNNIMWANSPSGIYFDELTVSFIAFCDIQGGWEGMGNIDLCPMFVDPSTGDYNICSQSPCIDAGDPDMQDPDSTRADIGFFYSEHPECFVGNAWHVSTAGNDLTGDGSFGNPFRTIQHAIDISINGDTIIVANGTYVENVSIHGKNNVLASNFIYTEDSLDILNTIIDGNENLSVITTISCDSTTVISGLSITNGYGQTGGGIYCYNNSNPIIKNNVLFDNLATAGSGIGCFNSSPRISFNDIRNNESFWQVGYGGGISCYLYSNPKISKNLIRDNVAHGPGGGIAGGIYCGNNSSPEINRNIIINNTANDYGGGIALYYNSHTIIRNNIIQGNSAVGTPHSGHGGAIYCSNTSPQISNNSIIGNHATRTGGGISAMYWSAPSELLIINNTIAGNSTDSVGGGIYLHCSGYPPTLKNTIIWANIASFEGNQLYLDECQPLISFCDIQDSLWPGVGNISVEPMFRDTTNGNYHLMAMICGDPYDSPCIDAGDPAVQDIVLDCGWGLGTIISDMGAYGGGDSTLLHIEDYVPPLPRKQMLFQNYPNPFNSQTTIKFMLSLPQNVRLTIYDLLGRQVRTLINEYMQAGSHRVILDASDLSSGVYFYRLQGGEIVETRSMVLIK
jgi:parallel beta-helix repeat protein/predicted outer membrane repeat protein